MSWLTLGGRVDPNAPSRRECHSVCVAGDSLLLFGGNDDAGRFREVHVLDARSLRWERVEPDENAPGRRSAHTAVVTEDARSMFIFGGWNGTEELGDVARFDIGAGAPAPRLPPPRAPRLPPPRLRNLLPPPPPFSRARARSLALVAQGRHDGPAARAAPLSHGGAHRPLHVRARAAARAARRPRARPLPRTRSSPPPAAAPLPPPSPAGTSSAATTAWPGATTPWR